MVVLLGWIAFQIGKEFGFFSKKKYVNIFLIFLFFLLSVYLNRCNSSELYYRDPKSGLSFCAIVGGFEKYISFDFYSFSNLLFSGLSLRSLHSTLQALLARHQALFSPTTSPPSPPSHPSSFSSSSFSSSFLFQSSTSPLISLPSSSPPSISASGFLTEDPIPEDFFFFSAFYSRLGVENFPNDPDIHQFCAQVF